MLGTLLCFGLTSYLSDIKILTSLFWKVLPHAWAKLAISDLWGDSQSHVGWFKKKNKIKLAKFYVQVYENEHILILKSFFQLMIST